MKKAAAFLLVLFIALQMCAAAFAEELPDGTKFSEMEYVRPDLEKLSKAADDVTGAIENGEALDRVEARLETFFEEYYSFYTMYTIARIRYFLDLSDEFYCQEYAACSEMSGTAEMITEEVYVACAHCPYAEKLSKDYFWDGFLDDYSGDYAGRYNDTVVALKARERELINEYYELSAAPVLNINGSEVDLGSYFMSVDDEGYYNALMEYYRQYNERYADIYVELVKVRTSLAREMGYPNVWEMQCDSFDRDFSRDQEKDFLDGLAQKIVPVYRQVLESGKGVEGLLVDENVLMQLMDGVMPGIGKNTDEAYRYMKEYELYDVSQSENKAQISFTSYLNSYEAPFSFVTCNSTEADILNFSHEFGHYAQMYASFNALTSLDLSECFSQAMEMLTVSRAGEVLVDEYSELLRVYKMSDILNMYIQQGMFARFEEVVYSIDPEQLNAEALNLICLRCAQQFGIADYYDAEYCSMLWSDVAHFYEYPFYVISYLVSEDAAMQIYEKEAASSGAGAEIFDAMLPLENMRLIEAMEYAGLSSPFDAGRLDAAANTLSDVLLNTSEEYAA